LPLPREVAASRAISCDASSLAIPESSSLGKTLPAYSMIITFDGLRSRCTMP